MTTLSIDVETYSDVDLRGCGVYPYAESAAFRLLMMAYAIDDGPVQIIDVAGGERIPRNLFTMLRDPEVIKTAWNAAFERRTLEQHLGTYLPVEQWRCSMIHALYLGLPGKLDTCAKTLGLEQQKDTAGKALIRYFSVPCKPTKTNEGRTRNLPQHDPERWERFKAYCAQDVEVERAIRQKLSRIPVPEKEQELWELDQIINDRGVKLDLQLVDEALACHEEHVERLMEEAKRLTGLGNPNSLPQLKEWLQDTTGTAVESLTKETVPELKAQITDAAALQVLEIREQLAKTSVKKYEAMRRAACVDGRARGLLQFYGANRTGRWAGRLVQVQNLPRNSMPLLDGARRLLRQGDRALIGRLWDSVPDVLSQLIRTAFVPRKGHSLIVADFSAIEARVIAWLAGERWALEVFRGHGKIYEGTAAQMFGVPVEEITKGHPLRQKGKVASLACSYGGSVGALIAMGALEEGLTEEELPELVATWRRANPNIVRLWYALGDAALEAVRDQTTITLQHGLTLSGSPSTLRITLPSGRALYYVRPRISPDPKFGRDSLSYEGFKEGRWGRVRTYGAKISENLSQAIARDCLAESIRRLHEWGGRVVMHVHDEVVLEVPHDDEDDLYDCVDDVCRIMSEPIAWAPGLPLAADGFYCDYYRKD